jgi:hypothetical protein
MGIVVSCIIIKCFLRLIQVLDLFPMIPFRLQATTHQPCKSREVFGAETRVPPRPSHSVGNTAVTAASSPRAATSYATSEKSPNRHPSSAAHIAGLSLHVRPHVMATQDVTCQMHSRIGNRDLRSMANVLTFRWIIFVSEHRHWLSLPEVL